MPNLFNKYFDIVSGINNKVIATKFLGKNKYEGYNFMASNIAFLPFFMSDTVKNLRPNEI